MEALADESATGNWLLARKRSHSGDSPGIDGPEGGVWRRKWALSDKPATTRSQQLRRWPYV